MTGTDIRERFESSLAPLRCVFSVVSPFSRRIAFRLRDGVGRETGEFAFPLGDIQNEAAFEAAIEQVRNSIERDGFRHRR